MSLAALLSDLTRAGQSTMLDLVSRIARTLAGAFLGLTLTVGHVAQCVGWMPSAQARMDCCTDGSCPMHKAEHRQSTAPRVISQSEADSCCASATSPDSSRPAPSAPTPSVAVLGDGVVMPTAAPGLARTDHWRTAAPVPISSPPRHVLHAVFLI